MTELIQPEPIEHSTLFRIKAKDLPLFRWFGLYLEMPMEDPNYQDGRRIPNNPDNDESKVVCRFGSWIERQEFDPEEWIVMTWFDWQVHP